MTWPRPSSIRSRSTTMRREFGCSASFWRRHSSSRRKLAAGSSAASAAGPTASSASTRSKSSPPSVEIPSVASTVCVLLIQLHQRGVEGAAAQIVDQKPPDEALPVTEFDGGRGRLIQQSQHRKSGAAERVHRQESLVAVGVGGHAQHDLQGLVACRSGGAAPCAARSASRASARPEGRRLPPASSRVSGPASSR